MFVFAVAALRQRPSISVCFTLKQTKSTTNCVELALILLVLSGLATPRASSTPPWPKGAQINSGETFPPHGPQSRHGQEVQCHGPRLVTVGTVKRRTFEATTPALRRSRRVLQARLGGGSCTMAAPRPYPRSWTLGDVNSTSTASAPLRGVTAPGPFTVIH